MLIMFFPLYSCVLLSNSRNPTHDYDSILPAGKIRLAHPCRQKGAYIRLLPENCQADLCTWFYRLFLLCFLWNIGWACLQLRRKEQNSGWLTIFCKIILYKLNVTLNSRPYDDALVCASSCQNAPPAHSLFSPYSAP